VGDHRGGDGRQARVGRAGDDAAVHDVADGGTAEVDAGAECGHGPTVDGGRAATIRGFPHPACGALRMVRPRAGRTVAAMTTQTDTPLVEEADLRQTAVDRLKKRRDFHTHLLVFVLVNSASFAIWALAGGGFPWPLVLIAFWGVGLVMNAYDVYFRRPIGEHEIEREIERLRES
jgi:hypothetical protein